MKRSVLFSLSTVALIAAVACSAPSKGALILAISTDMQAPKDVDVVSVYVETAGVVKFNYLGRVLPDGTVSLPSTLAIVEPDDDTAQVRIRVTAFQTQSDGSANARVLRDVLTTVPHERTALLRVPLNLLDFGNVTRDAPRHPRPRSAERRARGRHDDVRADDPVPTDPGYLMPKCDYNQLQQTSVAGSCVSATVDSTSAPDYSDDQVFGPGGTLGNSPACFDVAKCFHQAMQMDMSAITMADDGSCSFAITPSETGQSWNCALATTDGTGNCIGANGGPPCLVPLESDQDEGFTVHPGTNVTMVAGACQKLFNGAQLLLDKSSCQTKVESSPICQPMSAGAQDAGVALDASIARDSGSISNEGDSSAPFADAGVGGSSGGASSGATSTGCPGSYNLSCTDTCVGPGCATCGNSLTLEVTVSSEATANLLGAAVSGPDGFSDAGTCSATLTATTGALATACAGPWNVTVGLATNNVPNTVSITCVAKGSPECQWSQCLIPTP